MIVHLTCNYCNHKWSKTLLAHHSTPACPRCGDSGVVARKSENTEKVDYYQGCPPFPEKKVPLKDSNLDPFLGYDMDDAYGNLGTDYMGAD